MSNFTISELKEHLGDVRGALRVEADEAEIRKLGEELNATKKEIVRLEANERRILDMWEHRAENSDCFEAAGGGSLDGSRDTNRRTDRSNPARDAGLRTIDRHADVLTPHASDVLDAVVRDKHDSRAFAARYLEAVGDENYSSAFGKILSDPQHGHLRFDKAEVEAVRLVSAVMAERGMVEGTTTAGGFAVPFALDPSVILSAAVYY